MAEHGLLKAQHLLLLNILMQSTFSNARISPKKINQAFGKLVGEAPDKQIELEAKYPSWVFIYKKDNSEVVDKFIILYESVEEFDKITGELKQVLSGHGFNYSVLNFIGTAIGAASNSC